MKSPKLIQTKDGHSSLMKTLQLLDQLESLKSFHSHHTPSADGHVPFPRLLAYNRKLEGRGELMKHKSLESKKETDNTELTVESTKNEQTKAKSLTKSTTSKCQGPLCGKLLHSHTINKSAKGRHFKQNNKGRGAKLISAKKSAQLLSSEITPYLHKTFVKMISKNNPLVLPDIHQIFQRKIDMIRSKVKLHQMSYIDDSIASMIDGIINKKLFAKNRTTSATGEQAYKSDASGAATKSIIDFSNRNNNLSSNSVGDGKDLTGRNSMAAKHNHELYSRSRAEMDTSLKSNMGETDVDPVIDYIEYMDKEQETKKRRRKGKGFKIYKRNCLEGVKPCKRMSPLKGNHMLLGPDSSRNQNRIGDDASSQASPFLQQYKSETEATTAKTATATTTTTPTAAAAAKAAAAATTTPTKPPPATTTAAATTIATTTAQYIPSNYSQAYLNSPSKLNGPSSNLSPNPSLSANPSGNATYTSWHKDGTASADPLDYPISYLSDLNSNYLNTPSYLNNPKSSSYSGTNNNILSNSSHTKSSAKVLSKPAPVKTIKVNPLNYVAPPSNVAKTAAATGGAIGGAPVKPLGYANPSDSSTAAGSASIKPIANTNPSDSPATHPANSNYSAAPYAQQLPVSYVSSNPTSVLSESKDLVTSNLNTELKASQPTKSQKDDPLSYQISYLGAKPKPNKTIPEPLNTYINSLKTYLSDPKQAGYSSNPNPILNASNPIDASKSKASVSSVDQPSYNPYSNQAQQAVSSPTSYTNTDPFEAFRSKPDSSSNSNGYNSNYDTIRITPGSFDSYNFKRNFNYVDHALNQYFSLKHEKSHNRTKKRYKKQRISIKSKSGTPVVTKGLLSEFSKLFPLGFKKMSSFRPNNRRYVRKSNLAYQNTFKPARKTLINRSIT